MKKTIIWIAVSGIIVFCFCYFNIVAVISRMPNTINDEEMLKVEVVPSRVTHYEVRNHQQFSSFEQFWDKVGNSTHYHTLPPKYKWLREDSSPAETNSSGIPKIMNKIYVEKSGSFFVCRGTDLVYALIGATIEA